MILTSLKIYDTLKTIVSQFFRTLKFREREHPKGRKPKLTNSEAVTSAILWRRQNIGSKKSLYEILEPPLSYNHFVVALNKAARYLVAVIAAVNYYKIKRGFSKSWNAVISFFKRIF